MTIHSCLSADFDKRLNCLLNTKSNAVIILIRFWAFSASICGKGPQLTNLVLHSSHLLKELSVKNAGARVKGCKINKYTHKNTFFTTKLLKQINVFIKKMIPKIIAKKTIYK